jgi:cysteine desulfurase
MPVYFDTAATTQVDSRVAALVMEYMTAEFGNAGSRTHTYGSNARSASEIARDQVAHVVGADIDDVIFTSGATEADNLAILGIADYGIKTNRRHIVTNASEHKAVLEPIEHLSSLGFDVTYLKPGLSGRIDLDELRDSLREETCLVSIMHVNNETGVSQPLSEICDALKDHMAYFHVDAAQGFGKDLDSLKNPRIDMISVSGHKLYAPKGVGALITRKRNGRLRPPLMPLMYGGGQERKLRPGTLPVALVVGLGLACELAVKEHSNRWNEGKKIEAEVINFVNSANGIVNGEREYSTPFILNASFPGLDSEAFIVATKDLFAISNGSACTSSSYDQSHVLKAMGISGDRLDGAIRFSWSHQTEIPPFAEVLRVIQSVSMIN